MLKGTDISAYQASTVPAGDFVIIKATQGTGYVNSKLHDQLADARRKGLLVGFYHFPEFGNDPLDDARHFCAVVVPLLQAGDIVVLDHEAPDPQPGASHASAWGLKFLPYTEDHCDRRPWVYSNVSWASDGHCGGMGAYPYWCADPSSPAGHPRVRGPFKNWVAHQYSWAGGLDKDVFNGSAADWRALGQPHQEDDMAQVTSVGAEKTAAPQTIPANSTDGAAVRWDTQFTDKHDLFKPDKDGGAYSIAILDEADGSLWAICDAIFELHGLQPGDSVIVSWDRMKAPAKANDAWQLDDNAWDKPFYAGPDGVIRDELHGQFSLDADVRLRLRVYNPNPYPVTVVGKDAEGRPRTMAKVTLLKY